MSSHMLRGQSDIQSIHDLVDRLEHESSPSLRGALAIAKHPGRREWTKQPPTLQEGTASALATGPATAPGDIACDSRGAPALGSTVVDLDELLLIPAVRAATRLWRHGGRVVAFALVDPYNNLGFDIDPDHTSPQLEAAIVDWGVACLRKRNAESGEEGTLDASCSADNAARIALLDRHGFIRESLRTLDYARSLVAPIPDHPLPQGLSLRSVRGEQEVEALVALHRAAFGTDHMTVDGRLAIMRAPQYEPEMDLLAVAPNGELAAFCICGFDDPGRTVGYTDPIGTHARYQRQGLGRAIVTAGLHALRDRGATTAELGTSSENVAMQRLAEALGFRVVSESVWLSRAVD